MSDTVVAAIIQGACTIAVVVVGRILSHREHRETSRRVTEILEMTRNGSAKENDLGPVSDHK